jgi:hypothetical protein
MLTLNLPSQNGGEPKSSDIKPGVLKEDGINEKNVSFSNLMMIASLGDSEEDEVKTEGNNEKAEDNNRDNDEILDAIDLSKIGPALRAEAKKRSKFKTEKRQALLITYHEDGEPESPREEGLSNMF